MLDSIDVRRSLGLMLEDQGKSVEEQAKTFSDARKKISSGKLDRVQTGNFVVYVLPDKPKEVTVGKVTDISRSEQTVIVRRHKPITDNQLRLYWKPVYIEGGAEVLGSGSKPSTETVGIKRLLFPVQMHDGVISHAAARRLDHAGYGYEKGAILDLNGDVVDQGSQELTSSQLSEPRHICPAAGASLHLSEKSADDEPFAIKVEKFVRAGNSTLSFEDNTTSHPVHFVARSELQKWLRLGFVDFAELYRGFGELTVRVREAGCTASEGFDRFAITYELCSCCPLTGVQKRKW